MTLFEEHKLPFLLQNPSDMATFMNTITPTLIEREWTVHSNIPDFNIFLLGVITTSDRR